LRMGYPILKRLILWILKAPSHNGCEHPHTFGAEGMKMHFQ